MVIRIKDVAGGADTSTQGSLVYAELKTALRTPQELVIISFHGVQNATSSFVNTSFVRLLDDWCVDELRRRIRVINSSRQINVMIASRLQREHLAHA